MTRTRVVEASEAHLSSVVDIWTTVAAEGMWIGTELPLRTDFQDRFLENLANPASRWFAAEVDGEVVGALTIRHSIGVAELGMAILDGYRGLGLGRALVDAAVSWARSAGCHKVTLEVWPHNERALRLYRAAGFEVEGRRRRQYRRKSGELWDSIAMGLVLDTAAPGSPHAG